MTPSAAAAPLDLPHGAARRLAPTAATRRKAAAPRRVLVVDDSRVERRLMLARLSGLAIEVIEAESGEQALAAARERPVDIVLSDWMMPGMSGLDLCRALREDAAGAAPEGEGEGEGEARARARTGRATSTSSC